MEIIGAIPIEGEKGKRGWTDNSHIWMRQNRGTWPKLMVGMDPFLSKPPGRGPRPLRLSTVSCREDLVAEGAKESSGGPAEPLMPEPLLKASRRARASPSATRLYASGCPDSLILHGGEK